MSDIAAKFKVGDVVVVKSAKAETMITVEPGSRGVIASIWPTTDGYSVKFANGHRYYFRDYDIELPLQQVQQNKHEDVLEAVKEKTMSDIAAKFKVGDVVVVKVGNYAPTSVRKYLEREPRPKGVVTCVFTHPRYPSGYKVKFPDGQLCSLQETELETPSPDEPEVQQNKHEDVLGAVKEVIDAVAAYKTAIKKLSNLVGSDASVAFTSLIKGE